MSVVLDTPCGVVPTVGGSTFKPSEMNWKPTRFEKVSIKVLYEDPGRGEMTCLLKLEPGAYLPFKHPEIEQTLVLEGSVEEHDGTATADSGEDVDSIDSERSHDRPIWWRTT